MIAQQITPRVRKWLRNSGRARVLHLFDEACTLVNSKLGAYVRGGLAKRETPLVESHLDA